MLRKYACTAAELSCIVGNLFVELAPPCDSCGRDVLTICGTTYTGGRGSLTVTPEGFIFEGDLKDVEELRARRCLQRATGAK